MRRIARNAISLMSVWMVLTVVAASGLHSLLYEPAFATDTHEVYARLGPPPDIQLSASPATRMLVSRIAASNDARGQAFIVVDKPRAIIHVFADDATLLGSSPVLLGSAIGDHTVPGVGAKAIANVLPHERTTPAGRFAGETGTNARGAFVLWVDYESGVSMHAVVNDVRSERRLERLATPTHQDNRISYGCINVPTAFFNQTLTPAVALNGAVVYVLPDIRGMEEAFTFVSSQEW